MLNFPVFLPIGENGTETVCEYARAAQEMLSGPVLSRKNRPGEITITLDPHGHHFVEEKHATLLGIGAIEEGGVGGHTESPLHCFRGYLPLPCRNRLRGKPRSRGVPRWPSRWTEKVRYLLGLNRPIFSLSNKALVHR